MDSHFCPHCGSPAGDGATRCQTCGATLTRVAARQDTSEGRAETPSAPVPPAASATPPAPLGAPLHEPPRDAGTRPMAPAASPPWPALNGPAAPQSTQPAPWPGYGWPGAAPMAPVLAGRMPPDGPRWPGGPPPLMDGSMGRMPDPGGPMGRMPDPGAPPQPGYPQYPQSPQYQPPYSYLPGYGYPYPYGYYMSPVPPSPPRDTYGLVVAWITIAAGALAVIGGLIAGGLLVLTLLVGLGDGLAAIATLVGLSVMPLVGGILALVYGIGKVRRSPGRKLSVPSSLLFVLLAAAAIGGGVVLWNLHALPGPTLYVLPLVILSGVLPALSIVFFTARRLGQPTTTRRFWLSLFYGSTGAVLLALLAELPAGLFLNTSLNPTTTRDAIGLLITISVVAPLAEEGFKPLAAVLIMGRIRSAGEAFLLGVAAGIGFDIVETIGYIGMNQADWVTVSIERVGAGLLHGVGAGMAALGWYYLISGQGVSNRWLKGIGGLLYAVLQHAIFNGSNLLLFIPAVASALSQPFYLGSLPIESAAIIFLVYYVIILVVLFVVTGRLRRGATSSTPSAAPSSTPGGAMPPAMVGGAR